jgi:hypothetical protein
VLLVAIIPPPPHTEFTVLTVHNEQKLKQEWQNSPAGTKQTDTKAKLSKTTFTYLLPLNYFMALMKTGLYMGTRISFEDHKLSVAVAGPLPPLVSKHSQKWLPPFPHY